MKKFLAVFLALAMVFAMSSVAMAAEHPATDPTLNAPGSTQSEVKISISNNDKPAVVYHVDVTWTSMAFTYTFSEGATWDPSTHTYTNGVADVGAWTGTPTVEVWNHSNAAVDVEATYVDGANAVAGVTVLFDNAAATKEALLGSAENYTGGNYWNEALKATFTLTVSGTPAVKDATEIVQGAVTITIDEA